MERLTIYPALRVIQKKEWGEIFTGFECRNRYAVCDTSGQEIFFAVEERKGLFGRLFLDSGRPFTVTVIDGAHSPLIKIERPFRWFFPEATVFDAQGQKMGRVNARFNLFSRVYDVTDENGQFLYQILGPFFHPWTFHIVENGERVGKIVKNWSGLKELFTDADNFSIDFPAGADAKRRSVLLGAVFLIDFVHFEDKGRNN